MNDSLARAGGKAPRGRWTAACGHVRMEAVLRAREKARLYLNGKHVGDVLIRGWESSWGFGDFHPNENFSDFAVFFGRWSLLMHASDDDESIPREIADELREAEYQMDSFKARLYMVEAGEWRDIGHVNIDGGMIEWKER